MVDISVEENIRMHDLGIKEWHSKCIVLENNEIQAIYDDMENNIDSPLVKLAKLPFPKFSEVYLSRYIKARDFLKDPQFSYKLYLLEDMKLYVFVSFVKEVKKTKENSIVGGIKSVIEILNLPIETIVNVVKGRSNVTLNKFLYLTQYIDFKEASRLGLKAADNFKSLNSNGYELKRKLSILNPYVKGSIERSIGLDGNFPRSVIVGFNNIKIYAKFDDFLRSKLLPSLLKSYGEFSNFIGYVDREYLDGELFEYSNPIYRVLEADFNGFEQFFDLPEDIRNIFLEHLTFKYIRVLFGKLVSYSRKNTSQFMNYTAHSKQEIDKAILIYREKIVPDLLVYLKNCNQDASILNIM